MKVADLKVIDVIQMPQFENNIEACIKEFLIRTKIMNGCIDVQFKRDPIERLQEKKVFGLKALVSLYASVLNKTIDTNKYPSTLRTFIKEIGDEAFHRTVAKLKQAEEEQEGKQQIIGIKKDN